MDTKNTAAIVDEALALGGMAAPFIPNPLAQAIIILAAKYGPEVIDRIAEVLARDQVEIEDIKNVFSGLTPYESFGIPEQIAAPPVPAVEAPPIPTVEEVNSLPVPGAD